MAKMLFAKKVKYGAVVYPANTKIDVAADDVELLKQSGGWVVEEPVVVAPVEIEVEEVVETPEAIEEEPQPAPVKAKSKSAKPKAE